MSNRNSWFIFSRLRTTSSLTICELFSRAAIPIDVLAAL